MPDEIEIDTDTLRETVDAEIERRSGSLLRWISLTTALLAALAAIGSLRAGATVNEALLLKTESTALQAQASDQWAYYQAKGIKAVVASAAQASWQAAGKPVPPELSAQIARYGAEQVAIRDKAVELEKERDARSREAGVLLELHHYYALAVALFQIAIALGAIAALTRVRLAWLISLLTGVCGIGALVIPILRR
jgi:hypothetical protein